MPTNEVPVFDASDNDTNCCPRFHPGPWDGQVLRFDNKLFVTASTVAAFHVPLNVGSVFAKRFFVEGTHSGPVQGVPPSG